MAGRRCPFKILIFRGVFLRKSRIQCVKKGFDAKEQIFNEQEPLFLKTAQMERTFHMREFFFGAGSALLKRAALLALLTLTATSIFGAKLTIYVASPLFVGDSGYVDGFYDGHYVTLSSVKSSNTKVISISGGVPKAVGAGTATITGVYNGVTGTAKITVKYPLAISGAASVASGKAVTYTATMQGNKISDPNHTKLSWKVSNTKIATIDSKTGKLTGKAAGTVTVTATFKSRSGTFTTSKSVKITVAVKSLAITGAAKLIRGSKASAYKATATYSNGKKGTVTPTWKVSNTKLAKVDKNGNLSPLGVGKVKLTATFEGKSVSKTITIEAEHMKSVKISGAGNVKVGQSTRYKLLGTLTNGQSAGETPNATWKSSNTKIATIDKNGKLVAKAAGKVTITGTYKSKKTHTAKITVTIKK